MAVLRNIVSGDDPPDEGLIDVDHECPNCGVRTVWEDDCCANCGWGEGPDTLPEGGKA